MKALLLVVLAAAVTISSPGLAQQSTWLQREIYRGRVECDAGDIAREKGQAKPPQISRGHLETCERRKYSTSMCALLAR